MLSKDSVKSRMGGGEDGEGAEGMSYTEFTYQLLQAYDFSYLFEKHGVAVQIGGSDQWGNITAGTDLIRRVQQRDGAFGALKREHAAALCCLVSPPRVVVWRRAVRDPRTCPLCSLKRSFAACRRADVPAALAV